MKNIKKEITFIYTDKLEHQCSEPIAEEAKKRGYAVKFSDNIFDKCEIGFYCQHVCFPKNSKFSCVMLHDLGQQHGYWPNIWQNEIWNHFDLGFLPNKEWCDMWEKNSCYKFVKPKNGCYFAGWPKSDNIHEKYFQEECDKIIEKYKIDKNKKTVLYAPSWEFDNRQLEIIEACKNLDVNLIIKQFPWNPNESSIFKYQYDMCQKMAELSKNCKNVYVLDTSINIFNAINLCDLLVSEESSTLYEAMMMDKPVIAVSDWLIPDDYPKDPRLPDFPYDFAIHIQKNQLSETIQNVIENDEYKEKIKQYRIENYPNIGNAAKTIMDIVDSFVLGNETVSLKLKEQENIKPPKEFRISVRKRKRLMIVYQIKKQIVDKSKILTKVYMLLIAIKHRMEK